MRKKAILWTAGAVVGSLAVTGALTIALDALFTSNPTQQWATAVQSTATVVLVGVTGIYVWITYRQMKLQATPLVAIRLATQEDAARKVIGLIQKARDQARHLIAEMPDLEKPDEPNFVNATKHSTDLNAVVNEIYVLAASLPLQFVLPTLKLCPAVISASTEVYLLATACAKEGLEAAKAKRKWTWDGARRIYLADVRQPESDQPEWAELTQAASVKQQAELLGTLQVDISFYLATPL